MRKNNLFLSLCELFFFFIVYTIFEIFLVFYHHQDFFPFLKHNIILFVVLLIDLIISYSKISRKLENFQFSILSFTKILMLMINFQKDFQKIFFEGSFDFGQGAYFFFLMRELFNEKVNPYLNLLNYVSLTFYFFIYFYEESNLKILMRILIIFLFGCAYVCQNLKKAKKKPDNHLKEMDLLNSLGIGVLGIEKKTKRIFYVNNYFETLLGTSRKSNEDYQKFIQNFREFRLYSLKKNFKYLLKLKGKAAKSSDLFQKNMAVYEYEALKIEKENESRKIYTEILENKAESVLAYILEEMKKIDEEDEKQRNLKKITKLKRIKKDSEIEMRYSKQMKTPSHKDLIHKVITLQRKSKRNNKNVFKRIFANAHKMLLKIKSKIIYLFQTNNKKILTERQLSQFTLVSSFLLSKNGKKSKEIFDNLYKLSIYNDTEGNLVFFHITAHRESEINDILLETQNIIGGMVSSISHELRTPLNCSLNLLEVLANNINEETFQNFLHPILLSTKNLKFIINDLIDYSAMVSEKFKIANTGFALKSAILDVMEIISLATAHKGIDLELDYDEKVPARITSDPNRIKQILLNLLGKLFYL